MSDFFEGLAARSTGATALRPRVASTFESHDAIEPIEEVPPTQVASREVRMAETPQIESPASGNVNSQTAILVQYSPATHGNNWSAQQGKVEYLPGGPHEGDNKFPKLASPITINEPIYETLDQVVEILATHFAGQPPRVRSTLAPVADFDGDGKPDGSDPDPLDPTK